MYLGMSHGRQGPEDRKNRLKAVLAMQILAARQEVKQRQIDDARASDNIRNWLQTSEPHKSSTGGESPPSKPGQFGLENHGGSEPREVRAKNSPRDESQGIVSLASASNEVVEPFHEPSAAHSPHAALRSLRADVAIEKVRPCRMQGCNSNPLGSATNLAS